MTTQQRAETPGNLDGPTQQEEATLSNYQALSQFPIRESMENVLSDGGVMAIFPDWLYAKPDLGQVWGENEKLLDNAKGIWAGP